MVMDGRTAVWPLSKQDMLRLADGHGSLGSQPSLGPPNPYLPHFAAMRSPTRDGGCGVTFKDQRPTSPTLVHSELT